MSVVIDYVSFLCSSFFALHGIAQSIKDIMGLCRARVRGHGCFSVTLRWQCPSFTMAAAHFCGFINAALIVIFESELFIDLVLLVLVSILAVMLITYLWSWLLSRY